MKVLDAGFWMLDAGQNMEVLIPMCRLEGGFLSGMLDDDFWFVIARRFRNGGIDDSSRVRAEGFLASLKET